MEQSGPLLLGSNLHSIILIRSKRTELLKKFPATNLKLVKKLQQVTEREVKQQALESATKSTCTSLAALIKKFNTAF